MKKSKVGTQNNTDSEDVNQIERNLFTNQNSSGKHTQQLSSKNQKEYQLMANIKQSVSLLQSLSMNNS